MSRLFNILLILAAASLLFSSCYKEPRVKAGQIDEFYNLKNGKVVLPLRVVGKSSSKTAIIVLHGGPGGSAFQMRLATSMQNLENNYKLVYFDQRGSGITQGNVTADDLYVDKFADDVEMVVQFTKQNLGAESIFLLGTSWGGGLGTYYLTDTDRQADIKGFIAVSAAYNIPLATQLSRAFVLNYANQQIAQDSGKTYWLNALKYYETRPTLTENDYFEHAQYVNRAKGILWGPIPSAVEPGYPGFKLEMYLENFNFTSLNIKMPNGVNIFREFINDPNMGNITLPTLIIWGARDGLTPVAMADNMYNLLGTPNAHKRLRKDYLQSAHTPFVEEPSKFLNDVRNFVETYQ